MQRLTARNILAAIVCVAVPCAMEASRPHAPGPIPFVGSALIGVGVFVVTEAAQPRQSSTVALLWWVTGAIIIGLGFSIA